MTHHSPLVRELLRLAHDRGWSRAELAARLEIHPTLIAHVQAGRRRLTVDVLSHILRAFAEVRAVRDFVLNYLLVEIPEFEAEEGRIGGEAPDDGGRGPIPAVALDAIKTYLGTFLRSFYEGKGVCFSGRDTRELRVVVRALLSACEQRRISALATDANAKLSATFERAAMQTSLLVVERVDFASPSVIEVLVRRADVNKPSVVTVGGGVSAIRDPRLVRIARSTMLVVELTLQSELTAAVHA